MEINQTKPECTGCNNLTDLICDIRRAFENCIVNHDKEYVRKLFNEYCGFIWSKFNLPEGSYGYTIRTTYENGVGSPIRRNLILKDKFLSVEDEHGKKYELNMLNLDKSYLFYEPLSKPLPLPESELEDNNLLISKPLPLSESELEDNNLLISKPLPLSESEFTDQIKDFLKYPNYKYEVIVDK